MLRRVEIAYDRRRSHHRVEHQRVDKSSHRSGEWLVVRHGCGIPLLARRWDMDEVCRFQIAPGGMGVLQRTQGAIVRVVADVGIPRAARAPRSDNISLFGSEWPPYRSNPSTHFQQRCLHFNDITLCYRMGARSHFNYLPRTRVDRDDLVVTHLQAIHCRGALLHELHRQHIGVAVLLYR